MTTGEKDPDVDFSVGVCCIEPISRLASFAGNISLSENFRSIVHIDLVGLLHLVDMIAGGIVKLTRIAVADIAGSLLDRL